MDIQKVDTTYGELFLHSFTHPMTYVYFAIAILFILLLSILIFVSDSIETKYKKTLVVCISLVILSVCALWFPFFYSDGAECGHNYNVNGEAKITKVEKADFRQYAHFVSNHKRYNIEIPENQVVHKGDVIKIKTDDPYGVNIRNDGRIQKSDLTKISFKYKN